jgi:aminopeptidase N
LRYGIRFTKSDCNPLYQLCKRTAIVPILWLCVVQAGPARYALADDVAAPAPGIDRCVRQALDAVNTHNVQALATSATDDALASFAWVGGTTTRVWSVGILRAPETAASGSEQDRRPVESGATRTASPALFAVFHAWHTCQSDGDHVHPLTLTPQGWRLGPEIPETETGGFRVRDHDLHVAIDVPQQVATISDNARIERVASATTPYCLVRLSETYGVRTLTCDGHAVPFQQTGGVLIFTPPATRMFTLGLLYSGTANHADGDYIRRDEATLNDYWYPNIARLPATATITAVAPPGWIPLAQGELVRQTHNANGATTVTYRNDLPVCWFTVDMGQYHTAARTVDGHKLTAYLLRDDPAFAQRCLDVLAQALRCYETRFARFPYTRYGLVETRGEFGGALEAYSFATFGAKEMLENIPHELSHTWWGGLMPCTYTRSMWDESFAEYSDQLFHRLAAGDTSRVSREARHVAYGNRFDAFSMANACDTSDGRQAAVGYGKGALVMRVLEEEIGRGTLLRCIAAFIANHPRSEAAEWPEFEQSVNRVTSNDYRWFFAQWVERKGLPTLRLSDLTVSRNGKGYRLEGKIVQSGTPYRLRVPVLLRTEGGGLARQEIEVSDATTSFQLSTDARPQQLTIDPDNVLPLSAAEGTAQDLTLREE